MLDITLFLVFIVFPFFRVFQGSLLQNIHIIIPAIALVVVLAGVLSNRLNEYIDIMLKRLIPLVVGMIAVHFFLKTYDSAQIKISLLEIGGPLILFLWLIKRINIGDFKVNPHRRYAIVPAILFIVSGILSFALSDFRLETFETGLIRRISYLGVFLVLNFEFNRKEDFERLSKWILSCCFFVVTYGIIQAFGLDWHIWKGAFDERIFSTFGNPNFFAAWLVLILPLVLSKLLMTRKWYYFLLICGVFYALFITGTKGSWLGLAAELTVYILLATLYLIKGDPAKLKKIAGGMIIAVVFIAGFGISKLTLERIDSLRFRIFTWSSTMKMITEPINSSPLKSIIFGHGIESFKLVYPSYRRPEIFHVEGKHNTETDHAHNEFLEILYDEGIIGFVIYVWLLLSVFWAAVKRLNKIGVGGARTKNEYYIVALLAGTIGMVAHSSVSVHFRFVSSGYIFWVFMGLLVVHTVPVAYAVPPKKEKVNMFKWAAILFLCGLIAFNSFHVARRFTANIYHNKAIAYSKQRKWKKALEYYGIVQKYHPSFIMAYYFEGNVYNDKLSVAMQKKDDAGIKENYEKAINAYDRVLSMYPNYVQVHFQQGILHLKAGKLEKANISFRRYLNIVDPEYPFNYFRLGLLATHQKDFEEAHAYMLEATRRINPKRGRHRSSIKDAYSYLANTYLYMNDPEKAEKAYEKALEYGENKELILSLARLYERQGKKQKAKEAYTRLLKYAPNDKGIKNKIRSL